MTDDGEPAPDGPEPAVEGLQDAADGREVALSRIRDHAGRIARELAAFRGDDYGDLTVETDAGDWTLKYDAGDVRYLRFEPKSGSETYVVSAKSDPDPAALADALAAYDGFVEGFNEYVASFEGLLEDVPTDYPEVASTAELAAKRDRIIERIREVADAMAGQLHRSDGPYGTFATRVAGRRWELKWEDDRASYLRVGGSDGIYLLSQYEPPAAAEVKRLAGDVDAFVEAFNDHVEDLEADLETISLSEQ